MSPESEALSGDLNSRLTRSLTIELRREFFNSKQCRQATMAYCCGTNNEGVGCAVFPSLYALQLPDEFSLGLFGHFQFRFLRMHFACLIPSNTV